MKKTKKSVEIDVTKKSAYHDTWRLLKKYRDVVWSLELSVEQARNNFQLEYGSSVEDFLDSIYLAGADLAGSDIEHHAKCIERSHKMLKLVESSVELLRNKHKYGESYYWILYYSFFSPHQSENADEIVKMLRPRMKRISYNTYYRKRKAAVNIYGSVIWGLIPKDYAEILEQFLPNA
jgi:hypothetical protein